MVYAIRAEHASLSASLTVEGLAQPVDRKGRSREIHGKYENGRHLPRMVYQIINSYYRLELFGLLTRYQNRLVEQEFAPAAMDEPQVLVLPQRPADRGTVGTCTPPYPCPSQRQRPSSGRSLLQQ